MSCLAQRWPEAACRSAAGDEDVFAAVVVERLSVEATEESLELKPRDIEEPEPFVLGCPPQQAGGAVVERDVDSVVADRVPNRVGEAVRPGAVRTAGPRADDRTRRRSMRTVRRDGATPQHVRSMASVGLGRCRSDR